MFLISFIYLLTIYNGTTSSSVYSTSGFFLDIFLVVIITILALVILYRKFKDYLNSQRGFIGLIIQIIFYIPCLLSDIMQWALGEAKSTSMTNWILVAIEVILIVLFFQSSSIIHSTSVGNNMVTILDSPTFLGSEQKLMTAEQFGGFITNPNTPPATTSNETDMDTNNDTENDDDNADVKEPVNSQTVSRNFCLYFWLYLNDNHESNVSQLPVLQYGGGHLLNTDSDNPFGQFNVHPAVVCLPKRQDLNTFGQNASQSAIGHLGIYFNHSEDPVVVDVPYQKWNFIAFNYGGNKVDLFVNGELIYTQDLNTSMPIFNLSDYVSVGGNGTQGAIQKITYCPTTLSKTSIISIYNMKMFESQLVPTYLLR
jgi:hypothetical protein